MATQATAETATKEVKRRGRPKKEVAAILKVPEKSKGERGTDFQRLIKAHQRDTIVRAFVNLRRKLFNEGEPTDAMTASIKKRISDLQSKGNIVH